MAYEVSYVALGEYLVFIGYIEFFFFVVKYFAIGHFDGECFLIDWFEKAVPECAVYFLCRSDDVVCFVFVEDVHILTGLAFSSMYYLLRNIGNFGIEGGRCLPTDWNRKSGVGEGRGLPTDFLGLARIEEREIGLGFLDIVLSCCLAFRQE